MTPYNLTALLETTEGTNPLTARQALAELQDLTRTEPGCRRFEVQQCREAPSQFLLWESFDSKAALDDHLAMPFTRDYFNRELTRIVNIWVHEPVEAGHGGDE